MKGSLLKLTNKIDPFDSFTAVKLHIHVKYPFEVGVRMRLKNTCLELKK